MSVIFQKPSEELCPGFRIVRDPGIVYQADRTKLIDYGERYFEEFVRRADTPIANRLNTFRDTLTAKYASCILDVGIGSGEFIRTSTLDTYGFDINPVGEAWLRERGLWVNPYESIPPWVDGFCFWDVIEHIPEPDEILQLIPLGSFVFVSIPIFDDVERCVDSKHFKPNEHLFYFSEPGFVSYMDEMGYERLETRNDETRAGREGILTFVMRKRRSACES